MNIIFSNVCYRIIEDRGLYQAQHLELGTWKNISAPVFDFVMNTLSYFRGSFDECKNEIDSHKKWIDSWAL